MLTVWTILWGDKYPRDYVRILRDMVRRHLRTAHRFVCITDAAIDGVIRQRPQCDYPGWWQKIQLFKPGVARAGPHLWLDLDVVVVGDLTDLVTRYADADLAAASNWAASGHGGVQSSVMIWRGHSAHVIWDAFKPEMAHWPPRHEPHKGILWGDQEWITHLRSQGQVTVTPIEPGQVVSYKYHCRGQAAPPAGARVVVFHGKPDPDEVSDAWVQAARS